MVRAARDCGFVGIVMEPAPAWVLECNCSICRRYGALWAYARDFHTGAKLPARLLQGAGDLEVYAWGERALGFWRCRHCRMVVSHTPSSRASSATGRALAWM
jgi:hypothetical protein